MTRTAVDRLFQAVDSAVVALGDLPGRLDQRLGQFLPALFRPLGGLVLPQFDVQFDKLLLLGGRRVPLKQLVFESPLLVLFHNLLDGLRGLLVGAQHGALPPGKTANAQQHRRNGTAHDLLSEIRTGLDRDSGIALMPVFWRPEFPRPGM